MAEVGIGGGQNVYTPTYDPGASGILQVEFSRNPASFSINRYAQIMPVGAMAGYYLRLDEEDAVRIVNEQDGIWPIGTDRPTGMIQEHDFATYSCKRYSDQFAIPNETRAQAKWDIVAAHARQAASRAMTRRTLRAVTALTTAGSWGANTSTDLTALVGGSAAWTAAALTDADAWCQKTIQKVGQNVLLATGGVVKLSDLIMIINPALAAILGASAELRAYIKTTPIAPQWLQGGSIYNTWGIPDTLYGLGGVVVEDAVRVTSQKGGTKVAASVFPANKVAFVARPGGLVNNAGTCTMATLVGMVYEDMTVETADDPWNRRIKGAVVDNNDFQLAAPLSGWYIQDVTT